MDFPYFFWVNTIKVTKLVVYYTLQGVIIYCYSEQSCNTGYYPFKFFVLLMSSKVFSSYLKLESSYYDMTSNVSTIDLLYGFASERVVIRNITLATGKIVFDCYQETSL